MLPALVVFLQQVEKILTATDFSLSRGAASENKMPMENDLWPASNLSGGGYVVSPNNYY